MGPGDSALGPVRSEGMEGREERVETTDFGYALSCGELKLSLGVLCRVGDEPLDGARRGSREQRGQGFFGRARRRLGCGWWWYVRNGCGC